MQVGFRTLVWTAHVLLFSKLPVTIRYSGAHVDVNDKASICVQITATQAGEKSITQGVNL
jgi:hypothetical protein